MPLIPILVQARHLTVLLMLISLASCISPGFTPLSPGTAEIMIPDSSRSYIIHVPDIDPGTPAPLVIALHGTGGSGTQMLHLGNFVSNSEKHQYVVAAPNSLGAAFNEGSGRIGNNLMDVDDTAFIKAVISDAKKHVRIDPARVFVVGFSSGAAMAQRLALELEDEVRAFAAVSGHLWIDSPIKKPNSMLLVFGDMDPLNPITGGTVQYRSDLVLKKPSPAATAKNWANRLSCTASLSATTEQILRLKSWFGCNRQSLLRYIEINGLGHYWAGGPIKKYATPARVGPYLGSIDMTEIVWHFFQQVTKPQ